MPFDGSTWVETSPTDGDAASQGDDNFRDVKTGVRSRMAIEHIWPATQTSTAAAGYHTYISFSGQTGAPTLAVVAGGSTQRAAIFFTTTNNGIVMDSAGTQFIFFLSAKGLTLSRGTGTNGDLYVGTAAGAMHVLPGSKIGYSLVTSSVAATPIWAPVGIRAWARFTTDGTIISAYNVTSVVLDASSKYTVNFTVALADSLYSVMGMGVGQVKCQLQNTATAVQVSKCLVETLDDGGTIGAASNIHVWVIGT